MCRPREGFKSVTTSKRLSEDAWMALEEALGSFQWYKAPFDTMVRSRFAGAPEVVAQLNFSEPKRRVAGQLIAALRVREVKYQGLVIDALVGLAQTDPDFPHLKRLDDGEALREEARRALRQLKRVTDRYSELAAERERLASELEEAEAANAARRSHHLKLVELHQRFMAMHADQDAQQRGVDFESLLNELFALWDLTPRAAYNLDHEHIDGAFTFRTDDYLLEARWWATPLGPKELNDFKAKVDGKARNTLGLMVAVNGFTEGAIVKHSHSQTPLVLMDAQDLMPVLEGRVGLDEVLHRKRRHAAETGCPMFRAFSG